MKFALDTRPVALGLVAALALFAPGCGGGGNGGGGGGGAGGPRVLSISIAETSTVVYLANPESSGIPGGTQFQVPDVAINAPITFVCSGPINPASLPSDGGADGSIRIINVANGSLALGSWSVNPARPNEAVFTAFPPLDPADACAAGYQPASTYAIFIPAQGGGVQEVLEIDGRLLSEAVSVQFNVLACDPDNPPVVDPFPGPPSIISVTPNADPTAPSVTQAGTQGNPGIPQSRIVIDVNEPLLPSTINASTISILNLTANDSCEIPVALLSGGQGITFQQFGTIPGAALSRITLRTGDLLPDGDVFEIRLDGVRDLGSELLDVPQGSLLFTVIDAGNDVPVVFTDDFTTTSFRDTTTNIEWTGNGVVAAVFPTEVVGTGADGTGLFDTPITINTDNFTGGGLNVTDGTFNFTDLTINSGNTPNFTLSFSSPTDVAPGASNNSVKLRATGSISIGNGTVLNCNGRQGTAGAGSANAATTSRAGGWGGPGGGNGGTASPNTDGTLSATGDPGQGGKIDPLNPNLPGPGFNLNTNSALYGAGGGGETGAGASVALAAAGGGGGTASDFAGYGAGDPFAWGFTPSSGGESQDPSGMGRIPGAAGPPPVAFMMPLSQFAPGGSGGGAGGDRVVVVTNPNTWVPASAGGGGGGALRISAGGPVNIGQLARFEVKGGAGGIASTSFIGRGGGGSGGSVWIQTFDTISLLPGAAFFADGGAGGGNTPGVGTDGDGGRGGDGLVQLEDSDATTLLATLQNTIIRGEAVVQPFSLSSDIVGTATSIPIDTGSASVDYTSATANVTPTMVGTVEVQVMGIAENPSQPGTPATTATSAGGFALMKGPVPLTQISDLNGYRFFRFVVTTSFPPPPATGVGDPLPFASSVTVNYQSDNP